MRGVLWGNALHVRVMENACLWAPWNSQPFLDYLLDVGLREPSAGHLGMGPLLPPVATGGTLPSSTVGWWLLGMGPLCPPPQFSGPVSPFPRCDLRDTESYGPVSAQDKNNGYCLLSTSISVPGTLPGTCYLNVII